MRKNMWRSICFMLHVSGFMMIFVVSVSAQTWQGPSATPPQGNVPAPLNVGSAAQTKQGEITVTKLTATGDVKGAQLCIGDVCKSAWPEPGVGAQNLLRVLQNGADASAFANEIRLGQKVSIGGTFGAPAPADDYGLRVKASTMGLYAEATGTHNPGTVWVYGVQGYGANAVGVYGRSNTQYGVEGSSTSSIGVRGTGTVGVEGVTTNTGGAGVSGAAQTNASGASGVRGTGFDASSFAATFQGGKGVKITTFDRDGSGPAAPTGGDLYLDDAKAIRIDKSSASRLNIGNWGGSGGSQQPVTLAVLGTNSAVTTPKLCFSTDGSTTQCMMITPIQGGASRLNLGYNWGGSGGRPVTLAVLGANSMITTPKLCFSTDGSTTQCMTSVPSSGGLDQATADGRYVNTSGDTVTGPLTVGAPRAGYDVTLHGNVSGARLFWDASKSALRAGMTTGDQWDDANVGEYSFAAGQNTKASRNASTAFGKDTTASGFSSFAAGQNTNAYGDVSTALGYGTESGNYAFATGVLAIASGNFSNALGHATTASGAFSTAIGRWVTAGPAAYTIVIGRGISSTERLVNNIEHSFMVGFNSTKPSLLVTQTDVYAGGTTDGNKVCRKDGTNCTVKFPTGTTDPVTCDAGNTGRSYFNTSSGRIRVCNGTSWIQQ